MSKVAMLGVACAAVLVACATGQSAETDSSRADIARVKDLGAGFGPGFGVSDVGPTGIDPRLLGPQTLPPGTTFDPAGCASFAGRQLVPPGAKGNMAAVTAEGKGNRFIAIAVETSQAASVDPPRDDCRKVGFAGGGVRGLVEVVDAPQMDGVQTLGTHRVLQTTVDGTPRTGELYNYLASFGTILVIVTANPLVLPGTQVAPVDTQRARNLLTAAVAAVRG